MTNSHSLSVKIGRALLLTIVVAAPLLFSTATIEGFEDVKSAALSLTAIALIALGAVALLFESRLNSRWLRQPLVVGVLLFALSATLSTILSVSPRTSWRGAFESHGGLTTILGYVVLFFAARLLGSGRRLLAGVVLAAAAASGYALVQAARLDPVTWEGAAFFGTQPRPFATFGHANLLGAYLAMSLPLVAYLGLRAMQRRRWILLGGLAIAAIAVAVALVLTLSRAAWLAAACALLVLLAGWWCGQARKAVATIFVVLLLSGGCGCLVYQGHWLPEPIQTALGDRLRQLDNGAARRDIWQAGWQIYGDHPATGSGLDTFRLVFGTKRTPEFWNKEGEGTPTKAHNEAIHILATQGTLGGVALLVLLVGLGWASVQAWRRTNDRMLVVAIAASVLAFLVTNLFGFTVIATGSLFAVCAGLLCRFGEPIDPDRTEALAGSTWRLWVTPGIAVAAGAVAAVGVIEPLLANMACRRGDRVSAETPEQALSHYQQATDLDSGCDLYWLRVADAARWRAQRTGSLDAVRQARTALERAVALVPADAYLHANLGRLLGELARTDHSVNDAAIAAWRSAAALDPNNPFILAEASRTALVVGDYELARQYATHGVELYPTWAIFHAQVGAAALGRGDLSDAVSGLQEALVADWHSDREALSRTLAMLSSAELKLHDCVKAQEFAGQASVWLPQWPTPHLLRSQALHEMGQRDEAIKEYMTARKLAGQPLVPAAASTPR